MNISLIAAMGRNRVIGKGAQIPWRIAGEQKRFKELTTGHHLIFGRKTYESIGKPLPKRDNIVVTRKVGYRAPGCTVACSLDDALTHCLDDEEIFIGGGAEIYKEALPLATTIYLTTIERDFDGDVFFPEFSLDEFEEVSAERVEGEVPYVYRVYKRRVPLGG